ncbi:hypothetical protein BD779DRAFT_1475071 [Infundibulicybe gibba]|nr:hypothetical protein BD779DRAFT_1475071 [Infundibulicybe gibba]
MAATSKLSGKNLDFVSSHYVKDYRLFNPRGDPQTDAGKGDTRLNSTIEYIGLTEDPTYTNSHFVLNNMGRRNPLVSKYTYDPPGGKPILTGDSPPVSYKDAQCGRSWVLSRFWVVDFDIEERKTHGARISCDEELGSAWGTVPHPITTGVVQVACLLTTGSWAPGRVGSDAYGPRSQVTRRGRIRVILARA